MSMSLCVNLTLLLQSYMRKENRKLYQRLESCETLILGVLLKKVTRKHLN